jgi:prevent-host-death family protein
MVTVALAEAKARLSELVARAEAGEPVSITRRGKPAVRLIPEEKPRRKIDLEEMRRIAALSQPYVDLDGLSFVERMRREDLL